MRRWRIKEVKSVKQQRRYISRLASNTVWHLTSTKTKKKKKQIKAEYFECFVITLRASSFTGIRYNKQWAIPGRLLENKDPESQCTPSAPSILKMELWNRNKNTFPTTAALFHCWAMNTHTQCDQINIIWILSSPTSKHITTLTTVKKTLMVSGFLL